MVDEAVLAVRARQAGRTALEAAAVKLDLTLKRFPRVRVDEGYSLSSSFGGMCRALCPVHDARAKCTESEA